MAKISVEANQCDVCGYVWLPSGKIAVQCAKCRSRKWNQRDCGVPISDALRLVDHDYHAHSDAHSKAVWNSLKRPDRTIEYEE